LRIPNRSVEQLRHKIKSLYYGDMKDLMMQSQNSSESGNWTQQIKTYQKIGEDLLSIEPKEDGGKLTY